MKTLEVLQLVLDSLYVAWGVLLFCAGVSFWRHLRAERRRKLSSYGPSRKRNRRSILGF